MGWLSEKGFIIFLAGLVDFDRRSVDFTGLLFFLGDLFGSFIAFPGYYELKRFERSVPYTISLAGVLSA